MPPAAAVGLADVLFGFVVPAWAAAVLAVLLVGEPVCFEEEPLLLVVVLLFVLPGPPLRADFEPSPTAELPPPAVMPPEEP